MGPLFPFSVLAHSLLDKEAKHPCDRLVYAEHKCGFALEFKGLEREDQDGFRRFN